MYQHILVPVDASPCSTTAAAHALNLCKLLGSHITFVHVLEDERNTPQARAEAQALLEHLSRGARLQPNLRLAEARGRGVADTIIAIATEEEVELIIMGTHGREGLELLQLGSVARAVGSRTPLPLMIIPSKLPSVSPSGDRFLRASRALEDTEPEKPQGKAS